MLLLHICCIAKRRFWQRQFSAFCYWLWQKVNLLALTTFLASPAVDLFTCLWILLPSQPLSWCIGLLHAWWIRQVRQNAWKPARHGGNCSAQQFATNHGVHVQLPAKTLLHSADIAIATDTSSNFSSACACACGGDSAPPQQSATNAMIVVSAAFQSAIPLSMTVNTASEVHFNALCSLTQPCLWNTILDQALPISVSLGQCIWVQIYQGRQLQAFCKSAHICARALLHSMPEHCCTACRITAAQHARSLLYSMPAHHCIPCQLTTAQHAGKQSACRPKMLLLYAFQCSLALLACVID